MFIHEPAPSTVSSMVERPPDKRLTLDRYQYGAPICGSGQAGRHRPYKTTIVSSILTSHTNRVAKSARQVDVIYPSTWDVQATHRSSQFHPSIA